MKDTPINYEIVSKKIKESRIEKIGTASIRELKKLVDDIEKSTGERFVRMEMGIPGLPAAEIGINAEIEAMRKGIANTYPDIQGIPQLKTEASRFVKLFLNIDVDPEGCIPTVGSMQGSFASFLITSRMYKEQDTILFLDPGFPVHKQQLKVLGQKFETFDVYDFRGDKLKAKIESELSSC